jgi:hypothetical protein
MKFYVRQVHLHEPVNGIAQVYQVQHLLCEGMFIRTRDPKTLRDKLKMHPIRPLLMIAQDSKCFWCGCEIRFDAGPTQESKFATLDHLVPKSKGGKVEWSNCVMACFKCNNAKNHGNLHPVTRKPIDIKSLVMPLSYETVEVELLEESVVA